VEAEQAILGGILINNDAMNQIVDILSPDDFYREAHLALFEGMTLLYQRGEPIDIITLSEILLQKKTLEKVGGTDYLALLVQAVSTSAGIAYHAEIVRNLAVRRRLISQCSTISELCFQNQESTADLLEKAGCDIVRVAVKDIAAARAIRDIKKGIHIPLVADIHFDHKLALEAVKSGAIRHFFVIGGCDGAEPGRNYFYDFAVKTPKDTVILTLGCGKYRIRDYDYGEIGGIPRLLDMGQCNDAYGAIQVALALAEAFKCEVNDLPLSLVISWFEQKAVAVLLTLLALGVKGIRIGPALPAFVSPNVMKVLSVDTRHR